jgi:dihydropyrimidinase
MLSRLLGAPVLIVHVSSPEATHTIRAAQTLGARIYAETCPQYLVLTAEDMDRPGVEGAKWCCSPPLRDKAAQEAIWTGLGNGTFQVYSSDHAPYRFDETAKIPRGEQTTFKEMANGVPGIEMRLPILFSEGVLKKRLTINHSSPSARPTTHACTACTRARARSRSAPTPTSRSGIPRSKSASTTR